MKIGFIVDRFPSLSETFVLNQITGLIDLGHDIEIFAEFKPKEKTIHRDVLTYGLLNKVSYFGVANNKFERYIQVYKLIIKEKRYRQILLRALNIFKYGRYAASLRLLYLVSAFRGKTFDIIHCHFGPYGILGALLKEVGIQGKIITTFHGHDMSAFIRQEGNKVYEQLFRLGDLFLPVSEYWKNKLIELHCDKKKIMVHHMGIDISKFYYSEKKVNQDNIIKILTVGRLVKKKGMNLLFVH